MKTKLRLTLDVEYETNGVRAGGLKDNLEFLVMCAIGEGMLTGSSDAEVETYSYKVEELK